MPRAKKWQKTRSDRGKKKIKKEDIPSTPDDSSSMRNEESSFSSPSPGQSRRSSVSSVSSKSSSASKFGKNLEEYDLYDSNNKYDIIDVVSLSQVINSAFICKQCQGEVSISVKKRIGLASLIETSCKSCDNKQQNMNSKLLNLEISGKYIFILLLLLCPTFYLIEKCLFGL